MASVVTMPNPKEKEEEEEDEKDHKPAPPVRECRVLHDATPIAGYSTAR